MNRTVSFALLGISAIALAACAQAQPAPQLSQVPIIDALPGSPAQRQDSPRITARMASESSGTSAPFTK